MSMKKVLQATFCAATALSLLSGCTYGLGYGYPFGLLYTGAQIPHGMERSEASGPGKAGDKQGEACATGILFLAAFGDATLDTAKKVGGITEVHSVELQQTSILGLYVQSCTVVHGK